MTCSDQQARTGNPQMAKSALERLAELRGEVTDEPLHKSGRYFNDHSFGDLTSCHHGDTGNFRNDADGEAIAILWGLWRDGALAAITPMTDPTDPRAVADDPGGIVQQMPDGGEPAPRIWVEPTGYREGWTGIPDQVEPDDVEYIRADIARATEADLRAEVERLRALASLPCEMTYPGSNSGTHGLFRPAPLKSVTERLEVQA